MTSVLVTNDFPPKVGGIQSYLWELWRRLPPAETHVVTTAYDGAAAFDAGQAFSVERVGSRVLWPTPALARRVDALAREVSADVIFVDPLLPTGLIAPKLRAAPVVAITHGAEVTLPGHLPGPRGLVRRVLEASVGTVAAGSYPLAQARRIAGARCSGLVVPPAVDTVRFVPIDEQARRSARRDLGLDPDLPVVLGLSRLVPRKGFDVLLRAAAGLPGVQVAIGGSGRDEARLVRLAHELGMAPRVRFLGRVPDEQLPVVHAMADLFVMLCRDRWGGLEAEGFGIVFLEAAACGVPAIAGRSGGSHEAVADFETGFVVSPRDVASVRSLIAQVLRDDALRARMGAAARARAIAGFDYDSVVIPLRRVAAGDWSGFEPAVEPERVRREQ